MNSIKTPEQRQRPMDEAHKRASIYAASLVSKNVETRDTQIVGPLRAMTRRMFETAMGIRKRRNDGPEGFDFAYEQVFEAAKGERLDLAAQGMLGKIAIQEPLTFDLPVDGQTVSTTSFFLHPMFGGLQVDRLEMAEDPQARYILHSLDVPSKSQTPV